MTTQTLTAYLDQLERAAHDFSAAEDAYRRDIALRVRQLEQDRAFAFRRLNLMRSVIAAVTGAEDAEAAAAAGRAAFLRELEWTGATELQRQTLERFAPVVLASWRMTQDDGAEADAASLALADFEQWFAGNRNGAFLSLLEREVVELPLVEV